MSKPATLLRTVPPFSLIVMTALLLSCQSTTTQEADPDSAAFVTRLGKDTLVVEQFVRTPTQMEAVFNADLRRARQAELHGTADAH